jgi:serine/threonine-protein kinase
MKEPLPPDPTVDAVPDDLLDAGLAALFGPDKPSSSGRRRDAQPGAPELPAGSAGRYEVGGELGRGGMGAVLQGRDTDLQRDVALKVLLEAHQSRAELRQRFVEEAQIAGQLQHPGVAPVYELGTFADGRPFFSMKLVKGRTLAALLAARKDSAEDRPRLVGIFLQVCQTLAYAHARGVIHRDLKPANVMVGAFGEVQVMDWGLAKVLAERGSAGDLKAQQSQDVSVIRTQRSAVSDTPAGAQTQAGSVLGTPAYMAPEQARGEVELVDARADVFGLGALLCEILTGCPPFTGPTPEAMRKAQAAKLEDAHVRLSDCGADTELVGLARRCLAAEPWDRPRDASEVAAEVTAYQESVVQRLRQTELARAAEAARAEEAKATAQQERQARQQAQARAAAERRARKLTLALAASVLLTALLGGGGWLWLAHAEAERERRELERQAQVTGEVHATLERAAALRAQAAGNPGKAAEARALARRAEALAETGTVAPELVERARALLAVLDEEEADRRLLAAVDEARLRQAELDVKLRRFASERALPEYAAAFRSYGLTAGATEPARAAARVRSRPTAVRDRLIAALDDWASLATVVAAPERDWLRQVVAEADPDPWRGQFRAADAARDVKALAKLAREVDVASQPATTCAEAGHVLSLLKDHEAAVAVLQRAQERHPGDFWINHGLARPLLELNRVAEAVRFLTAAVALRPDSPGARHNLALALGRLGRGEEAKAAYRQAIALQPSYTSPRIALARTLQEEGNLDEAIREYRAAIAINFREPIAHNNLGNALLAKGQLDEAMREYRIAIDLDPQDANPHNGLGNALSDSKQPDEAIKEFRTAIDLDPTFALPRHNLFTMLREQGKLDEAIRVCRAAVAVLRKDYLLHYDLAAGLHDKKELDEALREYQAAIDLRPDCAAAHSDLGSVLHAKGRSDEAIEEFRAAIKLDPRDARFRCNLGVALHDTNRLDEAMKEFRAAIAINPKLASAHFNLGRTLHVLQRLDEAIKELRTAVALAPNSAQNHNGLGRALHAKKQLDEASEEFRAAIKLDSRWAQPHFGLGTVLRDKHDWDGAIEEYRTAVKLDPAAAECHCALGQLLWAQGRFAEARVATRRGLELLPPDHPQRPQAIQELRRSERSLALEQKLSEVLAGEAQPADDAERLELATLCLRPFKKLYAASVRFYREAFANDPRLAGDLKVEHRYNAACAAALAGAGKGRDDPPPDEAGRADLRRQARDWLRADLDAYARLPLDRDTKARSLVRERLNYWQSDPDLAGLRDAAALAKLTAQERQACRQLWADVGALLQKARETK